MPPGRVVGVDVARCLALVGMAATHIFLSFRADGSLHPAYAVAAGRAAALFAVLAGVSMALANGGRTPPQGRVLWAARAGVLARAVLLFGLGLVLSGIDSPPLVILAYYALLFAVGTAFLGLRAPVLAVLAAAAAVLTPVASHLLRQYVEPAPVEEPSGDGFLVALLLTGTYPVLTWTTYLFAGMAVGRTDLRNWRLAAGLLVGGTALAVVSKVASSLLLGAVGGAERLRGIDGTAGDIHNALQRGLFGTTPRADWRWLTVSAPHSGTTFDLAHTVGTSLAVLGACLLLARLLPRIALLPLAAAGGMMLSLYSAHVLALADDSPLLTDDRFKLWLAHLAVALAVATFWRVSIGRGPLEALASRWDRSARGAVLRGADDGPVASRL